MKRISIALTNAEKDPDFSTLSLEQLRDCIVTPEELANVNVYAQRKIEEGPLFTMKAVLEILKGHGVKPTFVGKTVALLAGDD